MHSLLDRAVGRDHTHEHHTVGDAAPDPILTTMAQATSAASGAVSGADPHASADAQRTAAQTDRPFRVLSLDGGGINGLAQAKALAALERETGKPASEHFDLMVGTSTGGLIALAMAARHPDDPNRPLMTATELVEFYEQQGPEIFGTKNHFDRGADWNEKPLEDFLKAKFGDARIQDTRIPVMVSAMDNDNGEAVWLRNLGPAYCRDCDANPLLWQAARATSAAPTKFKPVTVDMGEGQEPRHRSLIDGGVFANTPGMEAYMIAEGMAKDIGQGRDVEMLSIGTGVQRFTMTSDKVASTGPLGWAIDIFKGKSPIREMGEQGKETSADRLLADRMGARYHRWDIPLEHDEGKTFSPSGKLDDASPGNLEKLKFVADQFLAKNWDKVTALADRLAPGRTPGQAPAIADRASLRKQLTAVDPQSPGLLAIFGFGGSKKSQVLPSGPEAWTTRNALNNSASPDVISVAQNGPTASKQPAMTPAMVPA